MLASNTELSRRLDKLESKYDRQFKVVFDAIRELMSPAVRDRNEIGFRSRLIKKKLFKDGGQVRVITRRRTLNTICVPVTVLNRNFDLPRSQKESRTA